MLLLSTVESFLQRRKKIMIYPTISICALVLAVAAGSTTTLTAPGQKESPHADMMLKCATTCSTCAVECDACFHHCASLVSDGRKDHAMCMHCCVDCADCCRLCATLCARQSTLTAHAAECCAKCCEDCAAACEKMPDDKQMAACARSCRNCARECRDMVGMSHK